MSRAKHHKITVPTMETAQLEVPAVGSRQVTAPTWEGLKEMAAPAVAGAAALAKELTSEYAAAAGQWAKPRVEHGKEVAAPALAAAAHAVGPRIEEAKGKVEETLPKLTEALSAAIAAGNAARHEAIARGADAALVLTGEATAKRKKKGKGVFGGFVVTVAALAAAGALAAYFAKKAREQADPWATPLADPYVPPATGRDSTVAIPVADSDSESVAAAETEPAGETEPAAAADAAAAASADAQEDAAQTEDQLAAATNEGMPPADDADATQVLDISADGTPPEAPKG